MDILGGCYGYLVNMIYNIYYKTRGWLYVDETDGFGRVKWIYTVGVRLSTCVVVVVWVDVVCGCGVEKWVKNGSLSTGWNCLG